MSIDNLYDFFKKINYRRILPVLLCPIFFFTFSLRCFAFEIPADGYSYYNPAWDNMILRFYTSSSNSQLNAVYLPDEYGTSFDGNINLDIRAFAYRIETGGFEFPWDFNNFDYYWSFTILSNGRGSFDFSPDTLSLLVKGSNETTQYFHPRIISILNTGTASQDGFTVISEIPDNFPATSIFGMEFVGDIANVNSSRFSCAAFFWQVPKSDTSDADIVTAINNQTNNIMNAGSGFGGTTSGILSGNDELSGYIDEYTQIEQTMHNNFESAQSALIGDFTGFTWGSLANTLSWTSDYMQQIYLNSGDFKMMIILPLLLGIALFFIGRGAIILSNSNKDN